MRIMKRIAMATVMVSLCAATASGSDTEGQRPRGRHQGPPPEAYTACEGKSAGDAAELTTPRGDTITGTCVQQGDRMVMRPDNPPPDRKGRDSEQQN